MKARIFRPSKSATQSGLGKTEEWVLEYESPTVRKPEPLMGWTASGDTLNQLRLKFSSLEEAKVFADKNGLEYSILEPKRRRVRPRNYGDNFRYVEKS
jgi:hypothetical protein